MPMICFTFSEWGDLCADDIRRTIQTPVKLELMTRITGGKFGKIQDHVSIFTIPMFLNKVNCNNYGNFLMNAHQL